MLFGEKVKELRKKEGLTQEALAAELDITKRTLINYETGRCYPKHSEIVMQLAKRFSVSADYLMSEADEFVSEAQRKGGSRGMAQAKELIAEVSGLFAGGELEECDKDAVLRAIMDAYWDAKRENQKYARG